MRLVTIAASLAIVFAMGGSRALATGEQNTLSLDVPAASLYVQPGDSVVVQMNVANLSMPVLGCQALLGYDSDFFNAGSVAPGGGSVWDTVIYQNWSVSGSNGKINTAVLVNASSSSGSLGTQDDGTVAIITMTAKNHEGTTQVTFLPYVSDVEGTILAGYDGTQLTPYTINSANIIVDKTPPTNVTISADPVSWTNSNSVTMTFSATDATSGIDHYELSVDGGAFATQVSPYSLDVTGLTDGTHTVAVKAFDRAGNVSLPASTTIYRDKTAPTGATIAADPASWTNAGTVTLSFSATDATSGINHYELSVDGGAFATQVSPYSLNVAAMIDGTHTVTVKAIDRTGNSATADTTIYLDKTAPTGVTITASPASWTNAGTVTLSFSATDATSGINHYELSVDGGAFATQVSPYSLNVAAMSDGTHTVTVKAIDQAGNSATADTRIYLDKTPPTLSIDSAVQNSHELLIFKGNTTNALQGNVVITVSSSDASPSSSLATPPTVKVKDASNVETTLTASGSGPWTYTYPITSTTANGVATITASISDHAGNSTPDSDTFNVNKNQITGSVSFSTLVSTSAYTFNRDVVFVATDDNGSVQKTWDPVSVAFTNDTGAQVASGSYTLTDVPAGTTHLSAKTAWTLRKKSDVSVASDDGQAALGFVLLGGDLNGSNSVNTLDYALLKSKWFTGGLAAAAADINGDGVVNTLDYNVMIVNWFQIGDAR